MFRLAVCRARLALDGFQQMIWKPTDRLIGTSNLKIDMVANAKHEGTSPRNAQTNAKSEAAKLAAKNLKRIGRGYRNHSHYQVRILLPLWRWIISRASVQVHRQRGPHSKMELPIHLGLLVGSEHPCGICKDIQADYLPGYKKCTGQASHYCIYAKCCERGLEAVIFLLDLGNASLELPVH